MINKKSYSVQMSFDVTDAERYQAEKAIISFNYTLKVLGQAKDHLNIMLIPFKDHPDISEDQIFKFRTALRNYRDKSIEFFNDFKIGAFKCITLMQIFSSDTQTYKLMKSFISSIDTLEYKVNKFAELFSNLKSKDFVTNMIKSIENIQRECDSIEEIIDDRLKTHVQNNILARNWVDDIGKKLNKSVDHKDPLMIELFNDRQKINEDGDK